MSNVLPLFDHVKDNNDKYAALYPEESPLYFPVSVHDNYHHDQFGFAQIILTEKSIVRCIDPNKRQHLATVGRGYKVIHNRQLMEAVSKQFEEALTPAEVQDVQIYDRMSYHGRTSMREYRFPGVTVSLDRTASEIAFRTIIVNGYGGSSIKCFSGAIDFFCTNGIISGQFDAGYHRHTKGLQISDITKKIRRSIDVFYKQADIWQKWIGKNVTTADAELFFEQMTNERMAKKLMRQFLIEVHTHGQTVWALYSTLTYYATHNEGEFAVRRTDNDHQAATLLGREQSVAKWIETEAFQSLAEAA